MTWGRTVTLTKKRLTPKEEEFLLTGPGLPEHGIYKLRCDHIDNNTGRVCTYREEGTHDRLILKALTHMHERTTLETHVRFGRLTGKSRPLFRFTETEVGK